MSLLKKISGLFGGEKPGFKGDSFEIAVQCARCGEVIQTRIDLTHDLSATPGDERVDPDHPAGFGSAPG